ncbi:BZ3500_MvSof-1268-A1-R1_Chr1-3g02124 [Microbotryum saponariae]|uniref:NAD(+) diphosphatase n=1 Tax=Microbotryum saponariae TaxID=289078 RepID=A0A2X0KCN5_9BASI|nr:BZ3500_MvSof-1268-A1-R1_Chr1-3g02124 [Microbotryum saponariae]SCZ95453.1 BZ3501_MvSof-1269-A2-R1_Chr1-3g01726 [Microbotryum saponariae]
MAAFNTYFSGNPLNRLSYLRSSPAFLASALSSPKARFLLYDQLSPLLTSIQQTERHLHLLSWDDVKAHIGEPQHIFKGVDGKDQEALRRIVRQDGKVEAADQGDVPYYISRPALVFLGVDERDAPASAKSLPLSKPTEESTLESHSPHGIPYWSLDVSNNAELRESALAQAKGLEFGDLRSGMASIPAPEASIAAQGRAMTDWNTRNVYCPSCSRPVKSVWAGWKRTCIPSPSSPSTCASKKGVHNYCYPRTDPVVIMGVVSPDGESILLGRQKSWPRGFYSALAGFIESGETFEEAVAREVYEEAGIEVEHVKFVANQVWPFPSSLMMGGIAKAKKGYEIRLDLDNELEDARFFTRAQVLHVIEASGPSHFTKEEIKQIDQQVQQRAPRSRSLSPGRGGRPAFRMPPSTAIANTLITAWATNTWSDAQPQVQGTEQAGNAGAGKL